MNNNNAFPVSRQQRAILNLGEGYQKQQTITARVKIVGKLDTMRLEQAVRSLFIRHEILRTEFVSIEGFLELHQSISDSGQFTDFASAENRLICAPVNFSLDQQGKFSYQLTINTPRTHLDSHSTINLVTELVELYAGQAELDDEPLQYVDFSDWQDEFVAEDRDGESYWQDKKPLFCAATVKNKTASGSSQTYCRTLSKDVSIDQLIAALLVARHKFQHAFQQHISVQMNGRMSDDFADGIGAYAVTLPLALSVDEQMYLSELQTHVSTKLDELSLNQLSVPEELTETLGPTLSIERLPGQQPKEVDGITFEIIGIQRQVSENSLHITAWQTTSGITLSCAFGAQLSLEKVKPLIDGLCNLLEIEPLPLCVTDASVVKNPKPQFISVGEKRETSSQLLLHQAFEYFAEHQPEVVAVRDFLGAVTYRELSLAVNHCVNQLLDSGVASGSNVAVSFPRRRELLIVILAIHKLGAAYVPVEPSSPGKRFAAVLQHCQLLVADADVLSGLDDETRKIAKCWQFETGVATSVSQRLGGVSPEQTAYVLFTSGSTGIPKGVQVSQANLRQYLLWTKSEYMSRADYALVATAIGFDLTITGLLGPIYCGKEVHLVDGHDPIEGIKSVLGNRSDAALLKITPSHLKALNLWFAQSKDTSLRVVILGGEELHSRDLKALSKHPDVLIVNEYGPTEATVGCSVALCLYQAGVTKSLSIGKAIANTQLLVLDDHKRQVAPHQVGELYIAGEGLAQGYLAMPEMTEERFFNLELSDGSPTRVYRTGDSVSFDEQGVLSFYGRIDDQVKSRGFRIELAEIESQLLALEQISSASVIAKDVGGETKQIVAFVVAESLQQEQVQEVVMPHLKLVLPDYMLPSTVIVLDAMPLTNNGKIDKKQLESIASSRSAHSPYVAPSTKLEKQLCETWESVLQRDKVGIEDNYFSLGVDSIFSLQIAAQLKGLGIQIDVQDILTHQTIAALSAYLGDKVYTAKDEKTLTPFALLKDSERSELSTLYQDAYPMSSLQLGMVFHSQIDDQVGVYHDIFTNHVRFPWQESAFRTALEGVIQHHPILRTGFILDRETPLQVVHKTIEVPLRVIDISEFSQTEQGEVVKSWIETTLTRKFNWLTGPLFEVVVFLRDVDSFEFCLSFHHSLLDGWSRAALTTDLHQNYQQLLSEQPQADLRENWLFRNFIALEQAALQSSEAKSFFTHMLDESPIAQLPQQGSERSGKIALFEQGAFIELSQPLIALARQLGVSVKSVLLAVHFKVISEASGLKTALSCVSNHGRPEVENADKGLGLFLNLLPLKLDITDGSWQDYIAQVHSLLMESQAHRHFPLSSIQKLTGQDYSEVTFNYTHFHIYGDILSGENSELELLDATGHEQTNFDFQTEFTRAHDTDQITMVIKYDPGLFAASFIDTLSGYYLETVQRILADISAVHSRESLMGVSERKLLDKWQVGTVLPGAGKPVHLLFQEQAVKTPDAIAVRDSDQQLTYARLAQKSLRLASYLQEMEIGSGDFVGIYLERGCELLVAMLGTLLAGAAYVPIDPRNSKERLTHIVQDTGMELMLLKASGLESVPLAGLDTLLLDDCVRDEGWLDDWNAQAEDLAEVELQDTAYLIYTSGSTGVPKGVEVSHAGLVDYCVFALSDYYQNVTDGAIVVTSHGFDITVPCLYLPLLTGQQVTMLPWGEELGAIIEQLELHPNSLVRMTPTHGKGLLGLIDGETFPELAASFVIGGEALEYELVSCLKQHFPSAHFYNHYGPTEAVVGCCIYPLNDEIQGEQGAVPIGRPMNNTHVYVVDDFNKLAPPGTTGELLVAGICVAKGYLNFKEQTQLSFLDDVFGNSQHKVYRTGDRVRWNAEGHLEYVGRNDDLVKFNGYRIELGEVENALASIDGIHQSAVKIFTHEHSQRLVAYIVDGGEHSVKSDRTAQIQAAMQAKVAAYMLPQSYVFLEALPVSLNGKLDRKSLLEPEDDNVKHQDYQAPESEVEKSLCQVIQSVLPVEQVGRSDNFFNLGGDSIIAIQVASRAKRKGLQLTVKQLFAHPVISELAEVISESQVESIDQSASRGQLSLLPVQQRFFARRFDNKQHYNQALLLQVPTRFTVTHLRQIVTSLFKRHDALRLCFKDLYGQPYGEYAELSEHMIDQAVQNFDLTHLPETERQAELTRISNGLQEGFNLDSPPLFRAVYFRLSETEGCLLLLAHHLLVDGVSWRIIGADLESAYQSLLKGEKIELAPKTTSLQTWSDKLQTLASLPQVQKQLGFWKKLLIDKHFSVPGTSDDRTQAQTLAFSLSPEQTQLMLGEGNHAFRTQVNEMLIAALLRGFCQAYGVRSLIVELEGHGREDAEGLPDVTETVGWFTSIYPVALQLCDPVDIESAIAEAKRAYREIPMNGLGYGLLSAYGDDSDFSALAENIRDNAVLFNYLGQVDNTATQNSLFNIAEEAVGNSEGDVLARKNLNVVAYVQSGQLSVRVSYLGQENLLQNFVEHFENALNDMLCLCAEVNNQRALFESAEGLFASQEVDFEESIEI